MLKKIYKIFALLLVVLTAAIVCQAATFIVSNKDNSGAGSLRQAIIDASDGDTIIFATNLKGSIHLASPLLIDKNLTINGPGANILGVEGRSTPTESRVFTLFTGMVRISDLRISRGFSAGAGGGINVESGGILTLNNCLIIGNTAESAGGVFGGSGSIITITNSTITGNVSFVEGGGVSNRGGTLVLTNTTIIGNEAPLGGGVSVDNGGTATILNCTITENGNNGGSSGEVGGLRINGSSTVDLKNTIIARNIVSGTSFPDVGGTVNSQGNNLIGDSSGGFGFINPPSPNADSLNVNPQFGGFANNGGTTYTVSLLAGSPAINAGNSIGAPAMDQRGVVRPQGGTVDIGSYESGVVPPAFGKIVFVKSGADLEVYSVNADGSNEWNLTNNPARDTSPKWSPNGSQIAFVSDRDGGLGEIYVMDADGLFPMRLTNNSVADENPVWSPDGTKIAFDRNGQIFVLNVSTLAVSTLTSSSYPGAQAHPSWSPDGALIVFQNNRGFGNIRVEYIPSACSSCTNGQTFVDNSPDNFDPIWSPDGNTIAFSNDQVDLTSHSLPSTFLLSPWLNNIDFPTRPLSATTNPIMFSPAWSLDGTKLVYQNGFAALVIINADGSSPTNLGVAGSLPDWSGVNTPIGTSISALYGTTSITFSTVSTSGTTTAVPIDPTTGGTLPGGYSFGAGFPAYEITTTATYTAPITVCLQVPSTTTLAVFNALTLFHGENGVLVPRTTSKDFATKTICASVTSLSPFVVAQSLAPTSVSVAVGGRVLTAGGRGISKAYVSIVSPNGQTRTVLTNSFGYYRFDGIPAGQIYVISVADKRYQFANSTQVITVSEEFTELNFTAEP